MTTAVHPYVDALLTGTRDLPTSPHAWLNERRGAALERANALSVPTTRDEEWRFTDLTQLTRLQLRAPGAPAELAPEAIHPYIVPEAGARIVFVDGVFAPQLSTTASAGRGVRVVPLAMALKSEAGRLEPYLARLAGFEQNVFVALNTAHLRDGAVVLVGKNEACEKPVHILHVATQAATAAYPRCVVVAEAGAECTVIEEYEAISEDAYLTNAVTEIAVAPGARLRHIKLQSESARAFHIARCSVAVATDASYISHTVSLGSRLSRYDLSVALNGEGAFAQIDGLALISGRQLADTHTLIDHAQPNGRSAQLHKTIVGGAAHAVFNGKIFVRPGAQLTDSAQQSRNLLLSDRATVDTKPQLEIFADDVKCAHGATVGQLDAEQLFYLTSRGLSDTVARNLLTYAFGASVIERIPVRSMVERLERAVMAQTGAAA
ncbi:MAG TPA: Fe-S cluster assembly protein SufD [Burkholderiales bacterium]|nr:Fe-S cluster assembly protein SufD [Burkholderiales bacterium]